MNCNNDLQWTPRPTSSIRRTAASSTRLTGARLFFFEGIDRDGNTRQIDECLIEQNWNELSSRYTFNATYLTNVFQAIANIRKTLLIEFEQHDKHTYDLHKSTVYVTPSLLYPFDCLGLRLGAPLCFRHKSVS